MFFCQQKRQARRSCNRRRRCLAGRSTVSESGWLGSRAWPGTKRANSDGCRQPVAPLKLNRDHGMTRPKSWSASSPGPAGTFKTPSCPDSCKSPLSPPTGSGVRRKTIVDYGSHPNRVAAAFVSAACCGAQRFVVRCPNGGHEPGHGVEASLAALAHIPDPPPPIPSSHTAPAPHFILHSSFRPTPVPSLTKPPP